MKFIVITCVYNAAEWIARNVRSLKIQDNANFHSIIIDDVSDDSTADVAIREIDSDPRFTLIRNTEKKYCLRNTFEGIAAARPAADDVILLVDGDDWLPHERVLTRLASVYSDPTCWLTHGSCALADAGAIQHHDCQPYPEELLRSGQIRPHAWRGQHLRTFRYALWQKIPEQEFSISQAEVDNATRRALLSGRLPAWFNWRRIQARDLHESSGRFVRRATDKAMMYPLFELAGTHTRFISEILYIFNFARRPLPYDRSDISGKWFPRLTRDVLAHRPRQHQQLKIL